MTNRSIDDLRNKCRTCHFLALNDGNTTTGYCWQSDSCVRLRYYGLSELQDPTCHDIMPEEKPAWEPLDILKPYFEKVSQ